MNANDLKQFIFKTQRLLYAHLPAKKSNEDDAHALATLERYRPNMAKLSSKIINLPNREGLDLSILIPAYNVAPYIRECIQSVVDQDTSFVYEIIVVDDGSTDGTSEILDELVDEYGIMVLHQHNGGVAIARNNLLNHARGRYVMFLDSDDRLCPHAVEVLMDGTDSSEIDIVQGMHRDIDGTGRNIASASVSAFFVSKISERYTEHLQRLSGFPWGKVIRRDLFRDIRFVENIEFEDTILSFVVYELCKTSRIIPDVIYQYRINSAGITQNIQRNYKGIDTIWQVDALLSLRSKIGLAMSADLYRLLLFQCGTMLFSRTRFYGNDVSRAAFAHSANVIRNLRGGGSRLQGLE